MPFPKIFCHLNFQLKNRNGSNECSRFMRREKRNWEGKGLETRWRESNRRIFFAIHKMPNADSVTTVASGYAFHLMESVRNLVHQSQIYIDCSHYSMWRGLSFWIDYRVGGDGVVSLCPLFSLPLSPNIRHVIKNDSWTNYAAIELRRHTGK